MDILLIDDMRNIERATFTARTYDEGIKALQERVWDILILDHDLGCYDANGREKTGYDILCWLETHREHLPKSMELISMNPVGRINMMRVIDKLYYRNDGEGR